MISEGVLFDQTTVLTLSIPKDSLEQIVSTQIRCNRMRRLIRVFTICHFFSNFIHIHCYLNDLVEEKYKVKSKGCEYSHKVNTVDSRYLEFQGFL